MSRLFSRGPDRVGASSVTTRAAERSHSYRGKMSEPRSFAPWGSSRSSSGSALTAVLLSVIVVAALYFRREVLVPIAALDMGRKKLFGTGA